MHFSYIKPSPVKNNECNLRDVREIQIILQQYRAVTTQLAIFPYKCSSIDFGIYLHTIFHSVFTFTVQSPQNLRSNPYNKKLENGSSKFFFGIYLHDKNRSKAL